MRTAVGPYNPSPGRNIALRQPTALSSTFANWKSDNAVDGDVARPDDVLDQERTCAHSNHQKQGSRRALWLYLRTQVDVVRVDLFNRVNRESGKLMRACTLTGISLAPTNEILATVKHVLVLGCCFDNLGKLREFMRIHKHLNSTLQLFCCKQYLFYL